MDITINTHLHTLNDVFEEQQIIGTIRFIAKELTESDDELCRQIDLCRLIVSKKNFGPFYKLAMANLVAHEITIRNLKDSNGADDMSVIGGGISSQSEGGLSQSYVTKGISGMLDTYDKTIYGIEYKRIRKQCLPFAMTRFG